MGSRFFGLTPSYKFDVYNEIHDLVYYGKGGFIYSEVYNMPIHIRRYHIRKINEVHTKQNEEHNKQMAKINQQSKQTAKAPRFNKGIPS